MLSNHSCSQLARLAVMVVTLWLAACSSATKRTSAPSGSSDNSISDPIAGEGAKPIGTTDAGTSTGSQFLPAAASGGSASDAGQGGAKAAAAGSGDDRMRAGPGGQCPATATTTPGEKTVTIHINDATRTFIQHLPPAYTGKTPMPVVIDFHGKGGTGSSQKNATNWRSVADEKGFIMIWPDGVDNTWNAGRCCGSPADDVAFVRALIATLNEQVCIDPRRVYATGCSAGGAMSYKLACDAADVIAAVAPVDFDCAYSPDNSGNTPSCGGCSPARPIAEMQFRGTADSMAIYDGGIRPGGSNYHAGALQNFAEWGAINQCTGMPAPLSQKASCSAYPTCAGDAETILCTVEKGAHCASYASFGIVNLAWEIFQKHALP